MAYVYEQLTYPQDRHVLAIVLMDLYVE